MVDVVARAVGGNNTASVIHEHRVGGPDVNGSGTLSEGSLELVNTLVVVGLVAGLVNSSGLRGGLAIAISSCVGVVSLTSPSIGRMVVVSVVGVTTVTSVGSLDAINGLLLGEIHCNTVLDVVVRLGSGGGGKGPAGSTASLRFHGRDGTSGHPVTGLGGIRARGHGERFVGDDIIGGIIGNIVVGVGLTDFDSDSVAVDFLSVVSVELDGGGGLGKAVLSVLGDLLGALALVVMDSHESLELLGGLVTEEVVGDERSGRVEVGEGLVVSEEDLLPVVHLDEVGVALVVLGGEGGEEHLVGGLLVGLGGEADGSGGAD